jgi:hypothetical protein
MGWSAMENGDLLRAAEAHFDVFVTTDKNLRSQQNISGMRLAILVLPFASWPKLETHATVIAAAIDRLRAGSYVELSVP